jgi:hypothetical protein
MSAVITIESLGEEYVLIVDGGRQGIYPTAKKGARRFVHSTERIEWVYGQSGMVARITRKKGK